MSAMLKKIGVLVSLAAVLALGATIPVLAGPPHMENALKRLYEARAELQQTIPQGFGGHRSQALRYVDQAILEVQQAMQFAERGGGGGRWDDAMRNAYREGYKDGRHDFKTGQGNQFGRYSHKYERRFESQYRQGYEDGYFGRAKQY